MMPPHLILVPIDFSESSRQSLEVATDMASRLGSAVLDSELHQAASKQLSDLATRLQAKNLDVRTEVGTANDVGMELVRIAEHDHADMIVIATHGMTGWRRIAFGSVAQKVVEQAACPVLVLRARAEDHATKSQAHSSSSSAGGAR